MRKTIGLFFFTFYFILSTSCVAQDLKVLSATRQEVSGSLSSHHGEKPISHHGISYHFYLSPVNKDIRFDSLYMPNIAIKLDQTLDSRDPNNSLYVQINATGDTCDIYVSNPPRLPTNNGHDACPQRQFTGEGLIIYTYKGKTYAIPIVNMVNRHPIRIL